MLMLFRKSFAGTPVSLRFGLEKIYFVSGAESLQALFSNSRDLSTKALALMSFIHAFGLPASDAKHYEADDSGVLVKPTMEIEPEDRLHFRTHQIHHSNLTGSGLGELSRRFTMHLAHQIANKAKDLVENEWVELPDLFDFVKTETFKATTVALCGPHLLVLSPTFGDDFWDFDAWLPFTLKRIPRWLVPRAYSIQHKMLRAVVKWNEYASSHFDWEDENLKHVLWEENFGARIMRLKWKMAEDANVKLSPMGRASGYLGL